MDLLRGHIEALIFCAQSPAKVVDLKACLTETLGAEPTEEEILSAIAALEKRYDAEEFALGLYKTGGGYQFMTKPSYQSSVGVMLKQMSRKRLSTSALEVLAIIAYRQPISKTDIESIRGVNCDYAIRRLLERGLINIAGKSDALGKPWLYTASPTFMEYLGINDMGELPTPKEFASEENAVGVES